MSEQTAHDRYMQAASKIARIRTLQAELPDRLEAARLELVQAVDELGSDPLGIVRPYTAAGNRWGVARAAVLAALPGTPRAVATKCGMTRAQADSILRDLVKKGKATRSGTPRQEGGEGFTYHPVPREVEAA